MDVSGGGPAKVVFEDGRGGRLGGGVAVDRVVRGICGSRLTRLAPFMAEMGSVLLVVDI
jgi:hypothetical protein